MQSRIRLPYALLIVASVVFVTLLIVLTEDLRGLWPLYAIPILAASVAYHVSGTVVVSALVAAILGLLSNDLEAAVSTGLFEELVIGIGVLAVCGSLIGARIGRDERTLGSLRESTIRDELTGLHTRDYFLFRLEEDVRRSRRYETPLSVLFIELDGLEEFNARVGTHRGDLLVSHIAEVVPMSVRETDVLARIDGGLFGVVLPFAHAAEAVAVGERIRSVIEATDFEGDEIEPITHHTVSVGVAEYSHPSAAVEDLLERTDRGLQQARDEGGNRVALGPEGAPAEETLPGTAPREEAFS